MKNSASLLILLAALILLIPPTALAEDPPRTLHVPSEYSTIQSAIDAASDGDTVLVADGVYSSRFSRLFDFKGKAILVRSQNGPLNCILDGKRSTPLVRFDKNEGHNSVLDGFTLANCYSTSRPAIDCWYAAPTISNCVIVGAKGDGIICHGEPSDGPIITNCTIKNCEGVGIGCDSVSSRITNCVITNNVCGVGCGGYTKENASIITDCVISNNKDAGISIGMGNSVVTSCTITNNNGPAIRASSDVRILDCNITGNARNAAYFGTIEVWNHDAKVNDLVLIANSNISYNHATAIFQIDWNAPPITVTNCSIIGNQIPSPHYFSLPGGIFSRVKLSNSIIANNFGHVVGGINCWYSTIENCLIVGNKSDAVFEDFEGYGGTGGIIAFGCQITNCTFAENRGSLAGGGLCVVYQPTVVTNCIFYDNLAPLGSDIALIPWRLQPFSATINFSNVPGGPSSVFLDPNTTLTWGPGNIDVDPLFIAPGYWDPNGTPDDPNDDIWTAGDYHLLPTSPCIDAGDPNFIPEPNETDLDGNPRVIGPAVDIGAYEMPLSIEAQLQFTPKVLNCASKGSFVKAHLTLPDEILPEDIDTAEPVTLEPLGLAAASINVSNNPAGHTEVTANFWRSDLCSCAASGNLEITAVGRLKTGQYFFGSDTMRIFTPPPAKKLER